MASRPLPGQPRDPANLSQLLSRAPPPRRETDATFFSHSTFKFIFRPFSAILKHLSPAPLVQPQKRLLASNRGYYGNRKTDRS
jgi:hypothetical protein